MYSGRFFRTARFASHPKRMAPPTDACEKRTWIVAMKPMTQPLPMFGSYQTG